MAIDISRRIMAQYPKLSKQHKKLATAVLHDYAKIAYLTASRLALMFGMSESTVVRFASTLGYSGYSEFQNAVQELLKSKLTANQRIALTKKRIGRKDIIENVMGADMAKIRYTLEHLDRDAFYNSVDAILKARNIYVMGVRNAEPLARLLSYNLSLIFDNVKFVQPTSEAELFEQMFSINDEDLLIGFSFPRYSKKMIKAVQYAKSRESTIVMVTDSNISPVADHADHLLIAQSDMASFMDSLVAPLSIVNTIIVEITHRKEQEIFARFDVLEKLWDEYDVYTKR